MPELPEVETTRRGLEPFVTDSTIRRLEVRETRLRWPIASELPKLVSGKRIVSLDRRAKYLLLQLEAGFLMVHLGMSGSLRFLPQADAPQKHDHYDLELESGGVLRYNDPRRFGSLHYTESPAHHPLIRDLGPEPLGGGFDVDYLYRVSRGRKAPIKQFIMNAHVVVGIGNIYANEALHRAAIHPGRPAGRISRARIERLCDEIRNVLEEALRSGGTTLRDFVGGDGKPGYFRQSLSVYERAGEPCRRCRAPIRRRVIGQRASYFCAACQR